MERSAVVSVCRGPSVPEYHTWAATLAFDTHFTTTAVGILLLAEMVCGMLVWILVAGTDYFHLSALYWVMFAAIACWILTVCLFLIYLTGAHRRAPRVPWTTLSLCFNCCAAALYLVTSLMDAVSVHQSRRGRHSYNCWAASAFFAFLTTVCYAGSSYLSYRAWKTSGDER